MLGSLDDIQHQDTSLKEELLRFSHQNFNSVFERVDRLSLVVNDLAAKHGCGPSAAVGQTQQARHQSSQAVLTYLRSAKLAPAPHSGTIITCRSECDVDRVFGFHAVLNPGGLRRQLRKADSSG